MVSPNPIPQLPCRPLLRRRSTTWLTRMSYRVDSGARSSAKTGASASPASSSVAASFRKMVGWHTKWRARNVAAPVRAPLPTCENTWRRPSGVVTVWPAWAPPLKRTTIPYLPAGAAW